MASHGPLVLYVQHRGCSRVLVVHEWYRTGHEWYRTGHGWYRIGHEWYRIGFRIYLYFRD